MTTARVTKLKQFRFLPQTIAWLQKQADATQAIEQLVAKAEAEEHALIAATGRSVAEEELEICYEQITTLKQQLEALQMESQEYFQEIEFSKQELQDCNRELINLKQKLFDLNQKRIRARARYRLAFRRGDIWRNWNLCSYNIPFLYHRAVSVMSF